MSKMPDNEAISPAQFDESMVGNPEAFFSAFEDKVHSSLRVMIPVMVLAYERKTHNLWVQPLIALTDSVGRPITSGALPCTAIRNYSGKYLIDVPIARGDTGWLIAADRDTSKVKEDYDANNAKLSPRESGNGNSHQYEYGFFIPDKWFGTSGKDANKNTINLTDDDIAENRMVIQSGDATQRISIGQTDIKVYATDTTVNVENNATVNVGDTANVSVGDTANVSVGDTANVSCPTCNVKSDRLKIEKNGDDTDTARVVIDGKLYVSHTIYGGVDVVCGITEDAASTKNALSMKSHTHGYRTKEGGNPITTSSAYCHNSTNTNYRKYTLGMETCHDAGLVEASEVEKYGFNQ